MMYRDHSQGLMLPPPVSHHGNQPPAVWDRWGQRNAMQRLHTMLGSLMVQRDQ